MIALTEVSRGTPYAPGGWGSVADVGTEETPCEVPPTSATGLAAGLPTGLATGLATAPAAGLATGLAAVLPAGVAAVAGVVCAAGALVPAGACVGCAACSSSPPQPTSTSPLRTSAAANDARRPFAFTIGPSVDTFQFPPMTSSRARTDTALNPSGRVNTCTISDSGLLCQSDGLLLPF